ncbi:MAG: hypothetical protein JNJ46_18575 [Myxococcales bacterium]|nr:hypothetical protein [Myxococcales bacterium]
MSLVPILDIIFHHQPGGWTVQLIPDGQPRPQRPFFEPRRLDGAKPFWSLFEEDRDLIHRPWRLRLRRRAQRERDPAELPSIQSWLCLRHPESGGHILDLDWSVTQIVAEPERGETSGDVAVIENDALALALRRVLGSRVRKVARTALPKRALLVVDLHLPEPELRALQQRAQSAECPLIVWCGDQIPPLSELVEVVPCKNKMHSPSVTGVVRGPDFGVRGVVRRAGNVAGSAALGSASRMRCARRSHDVAGGGERIAGWGLVSL